MHSSTIYEVLGKYVQFQNRNIELHFKYNEVRIENHAFEK